MVFSKKSLLTKLAAVDKLHTKKTLELMQITVRRRLLKERLRSLTRKEEQMIMKKDKVKVVRKQKDKKVGAGRPSRWPGRCRSCCYRHFGLQGGPGHVRLLCDETKAWLAKGGGRCGNKNG